MDKKFVMGIAAMAALTLVSCSSDDLDSFSDNSSKNEAISFDGYLGRSAVAVNGTRGSEVKIGDLQTSAEGFGVFGYHNTTAHGSETEQPFNANLFNNQQVTYNNSKWTYSPLKFWPSDGHIDFLAYAPYNVGTVDNKYCLDFTVSKTITEQKDLLWAKTEDQTMANNSGTNKVKFQFKHALSRLGYTVKLYGDFSKNPANKTTFKLKKLTLAGSYPKSTTETAQAFYTKGTIDLSTGNWTPKDKDKKQDFEWVSSEKQVSNTGINNDIKDYLFVIPQNFSEKIDGAENTDKLYVIVEYTIDYGDGTPSVTNTVYKKLTTNFKQGKAYMLNLTLGLPIEFDVNVVEEWKAPDDGTGDINIGSNDKNPWDRE